MTDKPFPQAELIETTTALEALTRGEVDMQVATAKRYPRDLAVFRQRAMSMATRDPETAALCEYCMPRAGKEITGPSVRLAEIIASSWGNIRGEARPISEDSKYVTSQSTVWDLETNVLYRHETRRRITSRDGKRYNDDMINTTANAASSIAYREAVFKVVPRSEWIRVYEAAQKAAAADFANVEKARTAWLSRFAKGGVSEARVCKYLEVASAADIGVTDLQRLSGVYTSLSEGSVDVNEIFPPEEMKPGRQKASAPKKSNGKPKQEAAPMPPDEPPHDPETGEVKEPVARETQQPVQAEFAEVGPPPMEASASEEEW
jgi:hypothetical protein